MLEQFSRIFFYLFPNLKEHKDVLLARLLTLSSWCLCYNIYTGDLFGIHFDLERQIINKYIVKNGA